MEATKRRTSIENRDFLREKKQVKSCDLNRGRDPELKRSHDFRHSDTNSTLS